MKVSHAKDGGQAAEIEHAGLVMASRELLHTYPATRDASCGELREWAIRALPVLGSIVEADRQAAATMLTGQPGNPYTETVSR